MSDKCELSVIIVTWNSGNEIGDCLSSVITAAGNIRFEIIVIDNNSSDSTTEFVKSAEEKNSSPVKHIFNNDNKGFTIACNQGINNSAGNFILLLNPDTKIPENAITKLLLKLKSDAAAGAAAPQLLNIDGSVQHSCRRFPDYAGMFFEMTFLSKVFKRSKIFNRWKMGDFSHDSEADVEQPMGAALLIKSTTLKETGIFDEDFKMFFNDVDLCKRIYDKGYKIIFYPEAKFYHSKGVSIYKDRVRMIKIWNSDCLKYFRKHNYNFVLYYLLALSLQITGFLRILYYKLKK